VRTAALRGLAVLFLAGALLGPLPREGRPLGLSPLLPPGPAEAAIRPLELPGYPVRLFLDEREGRVRSAFLRTPGGTDRISRIEGLRFAAHAATEIDADGDGRPNPLWKLTFLDEEGRSGLHLWISLSASRVRILSSPIAPTLWDTLKTRLPLPRGTMLYAAPSLPAYGGLPALGGRGVLTFVYTLRETADGPAFVPAREVYRRLLPLMSRHRDAEFEPIRRLVYAKVCEDYAALAEGRAPSPAARANLDLRPLLDRRWRP